MNIRQAIIPKGITRKGRPLKSFAGVTIHNTGNHDAGADADANARYLYNNASSNIAGFHYVVDKDKIICTIPENEIAEHSGDREGNDTTVSIEICDNIDGNIIIATDLGAQLAADILMRHGRERATWKENLFQHNDWSGKNCPEDIRAGNPYGWDTFVKQVNKYMKPAAPVGEQPTFHISRLLKKGMTEPLEADEIKAIQRNLKTLNFYTGKIDGNFGPLTQAAVKAFQKKYNLEPDSIVGKQTTTAMGGVWDGK